MQRCGRLRERGIERERDTERHGWLRLFQIGAYVLCAFICRRVRGSVVCLQGCFYVFSGPCRCCRWFSGRFLALSFRRPVVAVAVVCRIFVLQWLASWFMLRLVAAVIVVVVVGVCCALAPSRGLLPALEQSIRKP